MINFYENSGISKIFWGFVGIHFQSYAYIIITHREPLKFCNYKSLQMWIFFFQIAEALLARETLNYSDLEELIGPPPHGKKMNVAAWGAANKNENTTQT